MEKQALVGKITSVIEKAAQAVEARESVTGELLGVARAADTPEAFLDAAKEADKSYREKSGKLPQPYSNAKSTIKYALKHGIGLGSEKKSYYALREDVRKHRTKGKVAKQPPEREKFSSAVERVIEIGSPVLLTSAGKLLEELVGEFETWTRRTEKVMAQARPAVAH